MDLDLKTLLEEYASATTLQPDSAVNYLCGIRDMASFLDARRIDVVDATTHDVEAWAEDMLGRLAPATARMYLSSARSFLAWLEDETGLPSPARHVGIGTRRDERERKPALSPSEAALMISRLEERSDTLSGLRDFALVRCVMLCCVRIKEAISADVGDFVGDPIYRGLMVSGRPVMIDWKTASCLEAYIEMRDASGEEPLFASLAPRNKGGRLTTRSVNRILAKALEPIGKKPGDVNFPRTAIEAALAGGAAEEDVREFVRMRGYDLVFQGERALGRRSGPVVDAVERCLGEVGLADVTAGEIRLMLEDLPDDAPLTAAIAKDGRLSISSCIVASRRPLGC